MGATACQELMAVRERSCGCVKTGLTALHELRMASQYGILASVAHVNLCALW